MLVPVYCAVPSKITSGIGGIGFGMHGDNVGRGVIVGGTPGGGTPGGVGGGTNPGGVGDGTNPNGVAVGGEVGAPKRTSHVS